MKNKISTFGEYSRTFQVKEKPTSKRPPPPKGQGVKVIELRITQ